MGQTLTHGVYLPDEGERNCYNGLATNWQILDTSVGTVAEHSTQIAGKAPLVHTHTKADITDFPVYGNTAGTICEGNDSRLSDARTPVAHKHSKADITDLFNSANTWTADNTFSGINSFSKNQIFQAGAYFYNSDSTAATSTLNLRNSKVTKGGTSDSGSQIIQFLDKDNKFLSQITTVKALSGTTQLQFNLGNIDSNDNSITGGITFSLAIDGTKQFLPGSNNTHNLGNSSYQWKTLNGINPGALSLPNLSRKSSILEYITDLTGGLQYYTPLADGWICIQADNSSATNYIRCAYDDILVKANGNGQAQGLSVLIPVLAGVQIGIRVVCTTLSSAYFYHCQGNVT